MEFKLKKYYELVLFFDKICSLHKKIESLKQKGYTQASCSPSWTNVNKLVLEVEKQIEVDSKNKPDWDFDNFPPLLTSFLEEDIYYYFNFPNSKLIRDCRATFEEIYLTNMSPQGKFFDYFIHSFFISFNNFCEEYYTPFDKSFKILNRGFSYCFICYAGNYPIELKIVYPILIDGDFFSFPKNDIELYFNDTRIN